MAGGEGGGGVGGAINKKAAHVRGRVDVTRPSAGSRLEEDLRNAFIMRWRFTAQLVEIYITSNNTSSKQGGPNPGGVAHWPIRAMNINDVCLCDRCVISVTLSVCFSRRTVSTESAPSKFRRIPDVVAETRCLSLCSSGRESIYLSLVACRSPSSS